MRVLFTTFAAKVHMYSQVQLAWALRTAGHEVVVASQPDLVADITRTGLTAVAVGEALDLEEQLKQAEELDAGDAPREEPRQDAGPEAPDEAAPEDDGGFGLDITETRPEVLTWEYLLGVFSTMTAVVFQNNSAEAMMDDLVGFAREWRPDLVVWDTLTFAGPVAARASGAAHARLLFGMDHVGRMRSRFTELLDRRPPEQRDDPLAEWLEFSLERYGCGFGPGGMDESMAVGHWTIDPTPSWLRFPLDLHYVPMRYVPYNGPASIPEWLHEPPKRRRVCISLGLSHREVQGGDEVSVTDLFEAVADLDAEVVATLDAGQVGELPSVPDNVRLVDFVPLNALLPTCSAIVSHGGSGTFSTALVHGVPQVVVPSRVWDSAHKADLLEERGAGRHVRDAGGRDTARVLRRELLAVLDDPSYAENAARVRREMVGVPSPNDIVPVLERLTREHRARR
ncbi:activator-dependent family glycosyltransferase [Spirillospora sp. NPDC050679]